MIEARNLTKAYGDKLAVDDLSFTVQPGIVTGFLGPNGAGKSTTMRMILGLDAPTSGTVTVDGRPYAEHPRRCRSSVRCWRRGRSTPPGPPTTTCGRSPPRTASRRGRVDEVVDLVGLRDVARKRAGGFSLGMGQRLGIASALLADPEILLLDEPVNGLDPDGVRWVRDLLHQPRRPGRHGLRLQPPHERDGAHRRATSSSLGRGRLIADMPDGAAHRQASDDVVHDPLAAGRRPRRASSPAPASSSTRSEPGAARGHRPDAAADRRAGARPRRRAARAVTAHRLARAGLHGRHRRRRRVRRHAPRPGAPHDRRPRSPRRPPRVPVQTCASAASWPRSGSSSGRCARPC